MLDDDAWHRVRRANTGWRSTTGCTRAGARPVPTWRKLSCEDNPAATLRSRFAGNDDLGHGVGRLVADDTHSHHDDHDLVLLAPLKVTREGELTANRPKRWERREVRW